MQFRVKGLTEGNILKIGIIIKSLSGTTLADGRILATPTEVAFEDVLSI